MGDNTLLNDGQENQYTLRSKDTSTAQNGSLRRSMVFTTAYPVDYGSGGCYHGCFKSGSMAAGLASASPVLHLRNTSSAMLLLLRKFKISAWTTSVGFAAGLVMFDLYVARAFTSGDTGGTALALTGDQSQLRTSMATSTASGSIASTGTLTAGTRTLDTNSIESLIMGAPTGTNTMAASSSTIFNKLQGEHPLMLVQNEGIVLQATVPATGVWAFATSMEWDEVPLAQY